MKYITTVEGKQYAVEIIDDKHVSIDGKVYTIDFESVSGQPVYSLIVDGKSHEAYVQPGDEAWQVLLRGRLYPVQVEDEREKRLRAAAGGGVAETGEPEADPIQCRLLHEPIWADVGGPKRYV